MSIRTIFLPLALLAGCATSSTMQKDSPGHATQNLQVSENQRFLQYEDGTPFFWLGDTAWLAFRRLSREEAEIYLEDRRKKGFNVVQIMVIHNIDGPNIYGDTPFIDGDIKKPNTTPGNSFEDETEYDFWDHVDYIVDLAAEKGIHVGMVAIWGSAAESRGDDPSWAEPYASFLAQRYKDRSNIIWLNGGDKRGDGVYDIWQAIGRTLDEQDPNHLITFHPFGRTQSSTWFHKDTWLDFNMFQSGHRRYDQMGDDDPARWKGEDSWRYVVEDYAMTPAKPTIDGEPSYEGIPQGLHDPNEPYWNDDDARRYAYWAVFAGAFGHTYGNNSIMQFYKPNSRKASYGAREYWDEAINHPGASQMQHLKNLILSKPYFERVFDPSLVAGENGEKYDYVIATRGNTYALLYTYTGRTFEVALGKISGDEVEASWYDPRTGESKQIGRFKNTGTQSFDPPGAKENGNDWVLVLDSV